MNDKKRTTIAIAAAVVLAVVVLCGMFVVTDKIQELMPSNMRFDEEYAGHLYARVPLNLGSPRNDLLVVTSSDTNVVVGIECYPVQEGFDVVKLLKDTGINYGQFSYSVYGIVFKEYIPNESPVYRFLFQETVNSKDSFFMSREVIPSYDYMNEAGVMVHLDNEGFSVTDVIDGINDLLKLPFM